MNRERIADLNDRQRFCLRLVHSGLTSKHIALRHGGTAKAIDRVLEAAQAKLGAPNRFVAAQMLADAEAGKSPGELQELAAGSDSPMLARSDQDRDWSPGSPTSAAVREERAAYGGPRLPWERMTLPVAFNRGSKDAVDVRSLVRSTIGLMLVIVIALAGLVAIAWGAVHVVYLIIHLVT